MSDLHSRERNAEMFNVIPSKAVNPGTVYVMPGPAPKREQFNSDRLYRRAWDAWMRNWYRIENVG